MRTTESIAARVSGAVTRVDQTIRPPGGSRCADPGGERRRSVDRPDGGLTLSGNAQEALGPLDRLFLVPYLHERPASDELFCFGERPVGDRELPIRIGDLGAFSARAQPARGEQDAGLGRFFDELAHLRHQLRARRRGRHRVVAQRVAQVSHDRVSVRLSVRRATTATGGLRSDRMCVTPSPLFMRRIRRRRIDIHPADRSTHGFEAASKGNRKVPGASRSSDSKETPKLFGEAGWTPRRRPLPARACPRAHPHRTTQVLTQRTLDGIPDTKDNMRRIVTAILSTVSTVVLLFGYHTSTNNTAAAAGPVVQQPASPGSSPPSRSSSKKGSATPNPGAGSKPQQPTAATTYPGTAADTQWGPVQVRITVQDHKITRARALQYPQGTSTDAQINGTALPILDQEVVQQQAAAIDTVSVATITSGDYLQSLQSAIDQAHL